MRTAAAALALFAGIAQPAGAWQLVERDGGLALSHSIGEIDFFFACRRANPGVVSFAVENGDFEVGNSVLVVIEPPAGSPGQERVAVEPTAAGFAGAIRLTDAMLGLFVGGTRIHVIAGDHQMTVVYDMIGGGLPEALARDFCGA